MRRRIRLVVSLFLGAIGLLIGVFYYSGTVTPLDRPFFPSDKKQTIVATRVDWMCNCAGFVDTTKYKTDPITEPGDNDYFFIEAAQPGKDWDRDHFIKHRYVRLTGRFYIDEGLPREYKLGHMEDKPSHARVFRFDEIEYLTTDNREEAQRLTTKAISHGGTLDD
jgi:hypothetical protein